MPKTTADLEREVAEAAMVLWKRHEVGSGRWPSGEAARALWQACEALQIRRDLERR